MLDTFPEDSTLRSKCLAAIEQSVVALNSIDPLDCSSKGEDAWKTSVDSVGRVITGVEQQLEERIRTLLNESSDDPAAMFRVCARFNKLFVRPSISAAIREYQDTLIATGRRLIFAHY